MVAPQRYPDRVHLERFLKRRGTAFRSGLMSAAGKACRRVRSVRRTHSCIAKRHLLYFSSPPGQSAVCCTLRLKHWQACSDGKASGHGLRRAIVVIDLEPSDRCRHHKQRKLF